MNKKVLSTVLFSGLLFAAMYSEARNKVGEVRTKTLNRGSAEQAGVNRVGSGAEVRTNANRAFQFMNTGSVSSSANQSRGLVSSFRNAFRAQTQKELDSVVNGSGQRGLKESLLLAQQKLLSGTANLASVRVVGRLIALANKNRGSNPSNKEPTGQETVLYMAQNGGAALAWGPNPRTNFLGVAKEILSNTASGFSARVTSGFQKGMNLAENTVLAKLREVRRKCKK